ncbi:hypothetical protein [Micromonospora sp. NPDC047074]|uniref:hypothetical protein n=1 Tax=Micromonospora sp. NPDC047074 TaxID=3154339 RepID=UPI0033CAD6B7
MRKATILTAIALSASLSTLGCSSTDASRGEPPLPDRLEKVNMSSFDLPLDRYNLGNTEALEVRMARDAVMINCVRQFGFTVPTPSYPRPFVDNKNERRYLLTSTSRARQHGYKWPEMTKASASEKTPTLGTEVQAIISGDGPSVMSNKRVPDGGCLGEANRHLKVDEAPGSDVDFVRRMDAKAYTAMKADSRVLAATARWSSCMESMGYHYPNPGRANDDPAFNSTVASSVEIATAVADVSCKDKAGLIDLMAAVETAYQNREIGFARDRLDAILNRNNAQIELARATLLELKSTSKAAGT